MDHDMEDRAKEFATAAHSRIDHRRKYTGAPYITHPAEVVELVRSVPHTEAMLVASWLHDTVDDTGATLAEIEAEFGAEVATLVGMMSAASKPSDGNRATRMALERAHIATTSPEAKTIRLGDIISNAKSIADHDPVFAAVYLVEKAKALAVLHEGDPTLYARAHEVLRAGATKLGINLPGIPPG